jgi:predicted TIM-barrel fold metal-dependent hydrolase
MSIDVLDADSHLTETPDLWSSRLPAKWRDVGPHIVTDDDGIPFWNMGGRTLHPPAYFGQGQTARPIHWEDIDPACYDGKARLGWMDQHGIFAQVLYPNVVAFESYAIMALEPELQRLVFRAYNDHQVEVASVDPRRFVLIAAVPFWDVEASIQELERCHEIGHRGVLWAATMERHGLPPIGDGHWDRFYAAAQELEMPITFHVGTGWTEPEWTAAGRKPGQKPQDLPAYVRKSALVCLSNANTIAELVTSEVCERFPRLSFVSVESGYGYVPYVLDALDWQWTTSGARQEYPDRLLPSEYFRRQVYTMFWFEHSTLALLEQYPDNVMFETDFPHPTSLAPTSYTVGIPEPEDMVRRHLDTYSAEVMRKVLHDTAARLYHLD